MRSAGFPQTFIRHPGQVYLSRLLRFGADAGGSCGLMSTPCSAGTASAAGTIGHNAEAVATGCNGAAGVNRSYQVTAKSWCTNSWLTSAEKRPPGMT